MGFTQSVEKIVTQLKTSRTAAATKKADLQKKQKAEQKPLREISYSAGGKKTIVNVPELPAALRLIVPAETTARENRASREASIAELQKLSPEERRKLAALARAGATNGSVKANFKMTPFDTFSSAVANPEDIQKGLEIAQREGLKLDASWK